MGGLSAAEVGVDSCGAGFNGHGGGLNVHGRKEGASLPLNRTEQGRFKRGA